MPRTTIHQILSVIEDVCSEFIDVEDELLFKRVQEIVSSRIGVDIGTDFLAEKLEAIGWAIDRKANPWVVTR